LLVQDSTIINEKNISSLLSSFIENGELEFTRQIYRLSNEIINPGDSFKITLDDAV
jgi:hypothetical protein